MEAKSALRGLVGAVACLTIKPESAPLPPCFPNAKFILCRTGLVTTELVKCRYFLKNMIKYNNIEEDAFKNSALTMRREKWILHQLCLR